MARARQTKGLSCAGRGGAPSCTRGIVFDGATARWQGGRTLMWVGLRKQVGRGGGRALAFDDTGE